MTNTKNDLIPRLLAAAQVLDDECISLANTAAARDLLREAAERLAKDGLTDTSPETILSAWKTIEREADIGYSESCGEDVRGPESAAELALIERVVAFAVARCAP